MYAIMNKDTRAILCENSPINHTVTSYFAPSDFNPYTGRKCLGRMKIYDCKEDAKKQAEKEINCIVVGVEPYTLRICKPI